MVSGKVCRVVLITRNELEMESETEKKEKNIQGISFQNVFFPLLESHSECILNFFFALRIFDFDHAQ